MRTYQRALLFIFFLGCLFSLSHFPIPQEPEVFKVDISDRNIIRVPKIGLPKETERQIQCLADNIYNEAGNQGYYGMKAVGLVTMNRVANQYFPSDVCDVVYQKNRRVCQFSWVCQTKRLKIDEQLYNSAKQIATRVFLYYEELEDITQGALFFHADYVNPRWNYVKTVVIGNHIFYRRGNSNDDAKTKSANEGGQHKARLLLADGRN